MGINFKAKVGCIGGYAKCNVVFQLLYRNSEGVNQSLGSWKELYGGGITTINIDLSSLAGQEVRFILRMFATNNYPDNAQGFWLTPRIEYIKPIPTHSPTPSLVPTLTETTVPPEETPTDTPEVP